MSKKNSAERTAKVHGPEGLDEVLLERDEATFLAEMEAGLRIDPEALEIACQRQPEQFYVVSKRLAMQISRRDAAKQYLEETRGRIYLVVKNAAVERNEKITEKEIEARLAKHSKIVEAQKLLLETNHAVAQWSAIKEAYNQRNYALKSLVDLYLSNYYGDTSSMSSSKEKLAETAKREISKMRKQRRA